MPDVETPPAESSPAAPATTPESTPAPVSVPTKPDEYLEWRKTGKLPEKDDTPSKREASAPSKPSVDEESEKGAPVSETGKQGRDNYESRVKRLAHERDTYKAKLEALEAGKNDASGESSPAPAKLAKADSSPAPAVKKLEDYDSIEAYLEDLADHKATQRLEAYRAEERQKAEQKVIADKLADAKKRYGDDAEGRIRSTAGAVFNDEQIPMAVKALANDSPVLVDLMYVMGSDPNELDEFVTLAKTNPGAAIRKLVLVEKLVQEELAKGGTPKAGEGETPQRDENGKFLPVKKTTSAPPPPRETSGRSAPPPDEVEAALKQGDFKTYREVENRREIARRKGL